jgi:transcription elongation factor Elf1
VICAARTSIRCGRGVIVRLNNLAVFKRASYAKPLEFVCTRCHQRWSSGDVSSTYDLNTASCSNCYAGAASVLIVKVELVRVNPAGAA